MNNEQLFLSFGLFSFSLMSVVVIIFVFRAKAFRPYIVHCSLFTVHFGEQYAHRAVSGALTGR